MTEPEDAPRELTPPPIQAPTAKEKKYDRQLRLWAASGQRALEESHVLMIVGEGRGSNGCVAGAETLKNLILPSIGHFTIADAAKVSQADLGVHFFLETSSLGKSRANETTKFLQELNPDVEGHSISEPVADWLPREDSLKPYNLIIICGPLEIKHLQTVSQYAIDNSVPLIYLQSVGFYATFSVQIPIEMPLVDTHPDPDSTQDLRLLAPWPELIQAEKDLGDLKTMADHEHGHIPYILILLNCLEQWKDNHSGSYPSNFKEKTEFRDLVRSNARTNNSEGGEENYDEACAAVLKTITPPSVGSGCREMLAMESCTNPTQSSANFWIIAHAIKNFYDRHGVLPVPGSLPDMKATSAGYIKLQTIYKDKARKDVSEVLESVRSLENELGRSQKPVDASEVEQFCKNAAHVRVLTNPGRSPVPELLLAQEPAAAAADAAKLLAKLPAMLQSYDTISPIFIAMNHTHLPAATLDGLKQVEDPMAAEDDDEGTLFGSKIDAAIVEVDRCQGAELHNTSSVVGGMVAQEAIKLLTRQYVPVNGTTIWDGIRAKTEIVRF